MTMVLQRIKDKRLTPAQECESRVVFELATEGREIMSVKQLKMCLRALGFTVTKGEALVLVYEFDYTNTNTIGLADFQKIFLFKTLDSSERDRFEQAFRSISMDTSDKVSTRKLSSALHATERLGYDVADQVGRRSEEIIDGKKFRHQMMLQYYDDEEIEAVQEFLDNATELRVPKAVLAAFLRV